MKWYNWLIGGTVGLIIVLAFSPAILYAEWLDFMDVVKERKAKIEEAKQTSPRKVKPHGS